MIGHPPDGVAGGLGYVLGRGRFYEQRGRTYSEIFRGSVTPVSAAFIALKYAGLGMALAGTLAATVPFLAIALAVLIGWLDWRTGVVHAERREDWKNDPYRLRVVELLEGIQRAVAVRALLEAKR